MLPQKLIISFGAVMLLAACVTPPGPYRGPSDPVQGQPAPVYRGATPSGIQTAGCDELVPIIAGDAREGYARETSWIARRYPNSQIIGQRGSSCGSTRVDIVTN